MSRPDRRTTRRGARGAITWVTVVILLALSASAYLAVVWVPVAVVHYEVKAVVRDFSNRAVKDPSDSALVEQMCHKLRSLDQVRVPDEEGNLAVRPAADVRPQDVLWARDLEARPPTLRVAFEYRRDVHYPILDRWEERTMRVDLTTELALPDWGPSR